MGKTSKIIVCGMKGVGKTAILEQLIYGTVKPVTEFHSTIEDIYSATVETDRGTKEKMFFYDTAGVNPPPFDCSPTSNYQTIPKHYTSFADGYVMIYDTRKPESLASLVCIHKDIERNRDKKEIIVVVLGNNTGIPDPNLQENTVTKASNWCNREKLRHFEVNTMERVSLYEAFIYLSSRLNPAPTKSSFPQIPALAKLTQKSIIRTDS